MHVVTNFQVWIFNNGKWKMRAIHDNFNDALHAAKGIIKEIREDASFRRPNFRIIRVEDVTVNEVDTEGPRRGLSDAF